MTRVKRHRVETATTPSAVPDVLGPGLDVVFLRHQPGSRLRRREGALRQSAQRLLAAAPRGRVHAAAARTARAVRAPAVRDRRDERGLPHDPGLERPASCGLRRLGRTSRAPRARAPTASDRVRRQGGLPGRIRHACRSTAPRRERSETWACSSSPRPHPRTRRSRTAERLEWFRALKAWLEPDRPRSCRERSSWTKRPERSSSSSATRAARSGGRRPAAASTRTRTLEQALRRELAEEIGLDEFELGPELWTREHTFAWNGRILRQSERIWLVEVASHEPAPRVDLAAELVADVRWWTPAELETATETLVPERLPQLLRELRENGPPTVPFDAGL